MRVEEINAVVETFKEEIAQICSKLVQIPTPNPPGRTDACAQYIKDYFDDADVPSKIFQRYEGKTNVCAKVRGQSEKTILWVGHIDVVPEGDPRSWKYKPYSGTITEDGRIYGRGSSDMKGSCAAAVVAARVLQGIEDEIPNVEFWFTCDEEIGGKDGALWLAQDGHLKGDVCIIGDSSWSASRLSIDLGCKGALRPKITARGVTAHGARPYLGDNAIEKLISVISHVKRIEDYRLRVPPELEPVIKSSIELLLGEPDLTERQREAVRHSYHYPTLSLNIMQAGVKVNVVPDTAEAIFDIRLTPGTRMDEVRERLLELVNEADVPGIDIEMDMVSDVAGYYELPNSFFVAQLSDAVEMATGTRPAFRILSGGTDAIPIKKYSGIPCLGFGGAVEGQAHVPNEYVTIDSLVTAAKAYAIFPLKYNNSLS